MGKVWGELYICTMATIKFIIRGNSETSSIYVRFKEGRLIDISAKTNFLINSKDWSASKGQPKSLTDMSLKKLNKDLVDFRGDLLAHYNESTNKLEINSKWLKAFINPPAPIIEVSNRLVHYFDYYALHKKNDISIASCKKLKVVKHLIERFEKETKLEYLIKDVNANFKLKFESYCLKENYAPNTIARTINFIKTICYHARSENDIETSSKLDNITTTYLPVEKLYLTPDELKLLENTNKLDAEYLTNARDWLIISCETGQRVSDFLRFTKEQIRYQNTKPLIEFTQVKTGKIMTVPLSKKVMSILKKRKGDFPRQISDQRYNEYVKDVCKLAGLTQKTKGSRKNPKTKRKETGIFEKWQLVSSHIGRRSFSTNNYGRIPTSLLISATGHSTEKMFLEYIGKSDSDKALLLEEYLNNPKKKAHKI